MDMENARIAPMTAAQAAAISQWQYGGIYAFYSHRPKNAADLLDGTHFAVTDADDALLGFFCFGADARIPTLEEGVYDADALDIGLGMRPDLCGQHAGLPFLLRGLAYAQQTHRPNCFRLSMAAFNERAIKVYARAGFSVAREVTNAYFKNKFLIMTRAA